MSARVSEMNDASPPRRRSWLLIVSLLVNVVFIAAVVAIAARLALTDTRVGSGGVLAPRTIMAEFPDRQADIEKIIGARTPRIAALYRASRQARLASLKQIDSADFTAAKSRAALDAVAAADAALEAEYVRMENDAVAALAPAERHKLVERIKRRTWLYRLLSRRGLD